MLNSRVNVNNSSDFPMTIYKRYCAIMVITGLNYVRAYHAEVNPYTGVEAGFMEFGVWVIAGIVCLPLFLFLSIIHQFKANRDQDNKGVKSEIKRVRPPLFHIPLYAISTYLIVFVITRFTGESGYWI